MSPTNRTFLSIVMPFLICVGACTNPPGGETARKDIVGTEEKLYSQNNEEIIIRDFFQDRRDGVFLDIGCAWPQRNNTTFYLEKHLGWSGIAVDALNEYGPGWAAQRSNAKFFSFLVTDHSDTEDPFFRAAWTGVSSAKKEQVEKMKVDYKEIKVPTITIDKLLELSKTPHIDFVSMDIEGAQMQALAGFDIDRYKPELICIEAYQPDRKPILDFFEEHGYERIERYLQHDRINWYFTPKG